MNDDYSASSERYSGNLSYSRCGRSGLLLPELSLGFWHNFGDNDDLIESRKVMHTAFDHGITHFDFANNYGPPYGSAETNCGKILKTDFATHRDELIISTKAGHDMWLGPYGEWGSRKHLLASLDQSLKRLQLDYVDIFYSHRPDPETPLEETMGALATAVQQGKALYIGISKYPLPMLKEAVSILRNLGSPPVIYQPPCNILNQWPKEEGILDYLETEGIGCIAYSPLAQGMLTDKYIGNIPTDSRAQSKSPFLSSQQIEEKQEILKALKKIADSQHMSLQHLALRWVSQQTAMTSVLIGARNRKQLVDNLDSLKQPKLTNEVLENIQKITSNS